MSKSRLPVTVNRHLEKTLQYLLYFNLISDDDFKVDFIKWSGLAGRRSRAALKLVDVQIEVPGQGVRFDIVLKTKRWRKNIELKVWSRLTPGQKLPASKIALLLSPVRIETRPRQQLRRWQDLAERFPRQCRRIVDLLFTGPEPTSGTLIREIKSWGKNTSKDQLTAVDLLLDRVWWFVGAEEINGWRASNRWSRSRNDRYLGFSYVHRKGARASWCWLGFIWDERFRNFSFVIEVSGRLAKDQDSRKRALFEYESDWYALREDTDKIVHEFDLKKLNAKTVGKCVRKILTKKIN